MTKQVFMVVMFAVWLVAVGSFAADPVEKKEEEFPPMPPVPMLSAKEQQKKFVIAEAEYRLEPVLSDPIIAEPVLCVFDANGRMYVAEMRTYMQDVDGSNEHAPVSRVSLHWSSRRNGVFDKHTVFADKLVLPRMVLPLDGRRVVIGETDTNDLFVYDDTNGDGVADKKEPFYVGGPRGGNLEHQPSGLIWSIDNWLYTTYNAYRLRYTGKEILKEPTYSNGGQWGLTQDNHGKPWWVNAGGEKGPWNFQTHNLYTSLNLPDEQQYEEGYKEVWPLVPIPDVQGGTSRFRPEEKTLNHFTATCGAEIFRGDRLPADLRGDLLFGEPVGRLIRRTKIEERDGLTFLRNAYPKTEFIRSTDPNFRPINMTTGPDGCLYIVDMYRGIIQEGNWVRENSYLRKVVQQYSLDKNIAHGRIWRLTHKDFKPSRWPRLNEAKPAQLVASLEHPNGWWRDTAQRLLVLRRDPSVIPALTNLTHTSKNYLARIHALWTLEGLDAVTTELLREKFKDTHPQVRAAAIRVSESLHKKGDTSLLPDVQALATDPDPNVVTQSLMTTKLLKQKDWQKIALSALAKSKSRGVQEIGKNLLTPPESLGGPDFSNDEIKVLERGRAIYQELCFACHGYDGRGMPMEGVIPGATIAPPLSGSRNLLGHHDAIVYILLHGISGPIDGKKYEAQMVSMASNDDKWVAEIASYVRNAFGNHASMVTPKDVAQLRALTKGRTDPWTAEELRATLPQPLQNTKEWRVTASHKDSDARLAADSDPNTRWTTGTDQTADMWFQIELPQETVIAGLLLDAGKSTRDYPRGYKVELTQDGQNWSKPIVEGKAATAVMEINFAPTITRFIRITQTGSVKGNHWTISELQVLQPGKKPALANPSARPIEKYE